jgi:hypothetical protein
MQAIASDPDPSKWSIYYTEKFLKALTQEIALHLIKFMLNLAVDVQVGN